MFETFRRLALGVALIALAASVLLYTDRGARHRSRKGLSAAVQTGKVLRVALIQHASLNVLEEGAEGLLEVLAERGYADGGRLKIHHYNAEGDIGTANAIAKEVTTGGFDLLLTLSTISLQTVHNANRAGSRTTHVFGLVSDPYSAGVGIEATNHFIHPAYLAGAGSIQPIEKILHTARLMRPQLKSVGLVWNAAEANSLAQTRIARRVCADLGIELVEANAENSAAVVESANSVISRGAECMLITGDVTVSLATDQVIAVSKRAGIPVFSALPPTVSRGTLFDLGANYFEIGRRTGEIAADVLDGKNPAQMPIENFAPVIFLYNETVLAGLKDRWTIPEAVRRDAIGWITATETNLPVLSAVSKKPGPKPQAGRVYKIGLAYFAPEAAADVCIKGIFDGLREQGFEEGKNLQVRRSHAQAEIANISTMLQNFDSSDVDVVVPMSTPVISGACGLVKNKPIVFTYCSDPVAAGAGKTFTNHLPSVTGIGSFPPVKDMVDVIHRTLPGAKSVGTIYNASEANSVKVISVARDLFTGAGLKLEEVTVANASEVLQAGQALVGRAVDAIYIQGDNTVIQGFDAVVKVARDARLPLFVDDVDTAKRGALACVGLGFYRPGYELRKSLSRVLLGESPANIPIENVSEKEVWLDLPQAARLGIKFPDDIIRESESKGAKPSDRGTKQATSPSTPARKFKVDVIEYIDTPNVEENRKGIRAGLEKGGLRSGKDFEFRVRNAQGDMATLSTMIDAAVSDETDLLLVCTTPALQAALRRAGNHNVVFSLVANPVIAGAGRSNQDHAPNVTGAYIPAAHPEGLAALRRCLPKARRIGTLFVPAEINSVFYKDELLKAATDLGLDVEVVAVSNSNEITDAAIALCSRNVDAVCQISDNLTGASFASIAQATQRGRVPLMAFASAQVKNGAFMAVSRDFYDGGLASGQIAARVLLGESPARIPFQPVETIKYIFNRTAAAAVGVSIPQELLRRGEAIN
jgi:ABC-type uncharacterized transport system substrate-binding protein